jgi:hypothetical protein
VTAVAIFLCRFQTTVLSRFIFSSTPPPSKFTENRSLSFLSDARRITATFRRHPVALSRHTRLPWVRLVPVHSMPLHALFSFFLARLRPTDLGSEQLAWSRSFLSFLALSGLQIIPARKLILPLSISTHRPPLRRNDSIQTGWTLMPLDATLNNFGN